MQVWSKSLTGIDLGGGSQDFRVVVVTSRSRLRCHGSLDSICTGNPTQTSCYDYDGSLSGGISFIHSYNAGGGSPSATNPIARDVRLTGGCGVGVTTPAPESNPYFNVDDGDPCAAIGINATIDFGTAVGADPTDPVALGGVCAEVSSSPGGTMSYAGGVWTAFFLRRHPGPTRSTSPQRPTHPGAVTAGTTRATRFRRWRSRTSPTTIRVPCSTSRS